MVVCLVAYHLFVCHDIIFLLSMNILLALFITLAVELLIVTIFFFKDLKVLISLSVANIVLNITMNLLIGLMPSTFTYYLFLILFEVFTTAVEALILIFICKKPLFKSCIVSLLANSGSLAIGLLVNILNPDIKTKVILIVTFGVIYAIVVAVNVSFYILDKKK